MATNWCGFLLVTCLLLQVFCQDAIQLNNKQPNSPNSTTDNLPPQPQKMNKYYFKTLTGNLISVDVLPTHTVRATKQIISKMQNIPANEQRLIYNGKQLADGELMSSVPAGATLHLILQIAGKNKRRVNSPLDAPQLKSPEEFVPVFEQTSINAVEYQFIMLNAGRFRIAVEPTDTVLQVKQRIEKQKNFPVDQQRLIWNGIQLDNTKLFSLYKVPVDHQISLIFRRKPNK